MAEPGKKAPKKTSSRSATRNAGSSSKNAGSSSKNAGSSSENVSANEIADAPSGPDASAPMEDVRAPAEKSAEATVAYEVVKPPQTVDPRRGGGLLVFTLFIAVVGLATYATWPLWSPYVAPRFPALEYKPATDPRVAGIAGRLEALEAKTSGGVVRSATISDMEQERVRLQQEVGQLLSRLDTLEETISGVKDIVVATSVKTPDGETKRVLEEITARLAELEKSGDSLGTLDARVDQLENETARGTDAASQQVTEAKTQISSMIGKLEDRMNTLESTGTDQQSAQSSASAIVLAVSQLRKSATSGAPFETDVETLKALSKNHTEMQAALLVLEQNAKTGTATIDQLRNQFSGLADAIVREDNVDAGNNWFESAKKRVLSLVSIRKLGGASDTVTVDSLVVLTEDHLRKGDIAAAVSNVEELKTVSEVAAKVAEPWLTVAKNRLKTERAVASLHVYAVALIASGKS